MTWVKDSDDTARRPELRSAGRDAALLWFVAMRECAAVDGDGLLPPLLVEDAAHLYRLKPGPASRALIEQGLWHDAASQCGDCLDRSGPIPAGHLLIHRWWEHLLHSDGKDDPIKRKREQRRKALNRNKELVARIRERDRDLCRYCGELTLDSSGPNKRASRVRQLDHVDPWGDNTFENVVVACRTCNGRKKDRTPGEAGMRLLDPGTVKPTGPGRTRPPAGSGPETAGSDRAVAALERAVDPAGPGLPREAGPGRFGAGQTGPGSGPAPGRVPAPVSNGNGHQA